MATAGAIAGGGGGGSGLAAGAAFKALGGGKQEDQGSGQGIPRFSFESKNFAVVLFLLQLLHMENGNWL